MVTKIGIGIALVVVAIIAYSIMGGKSIIPPPPTPGEHCTATVQCVDKWVDFATGNTVLPVESICQGGVIQKPYFGPGKCANPCGQSRTACWDDTKGIGICYPGAGAVCPCNTDSDCGAPQGKCGSDRKCACAPGWSGPACATPSGTPCDMKNPTACGNGACVSGYCVCDDGWVDNNIGGVTKPCSICDDKRGPPGNCKLVKYPNIAVPVPIGSVIDPVSGAIKKCIPSNTAPQDVCSQYYPGSIPAAISPPNGSPGNTICADTSTCPAYKQGLGDTYALACMSPNRANGGIWASPNFDAANYKWDMPDKDCKLALPTGFVGNFY